MAIEESCILNQDLFRCEQASCQHQQEYQRDGSQDLPCVASFHFLGRRNKEYGLPDPESAGANDRPVDTRVVLLHTDDRLHHFWRRLRCIRIKVHHPAAFVEHCDGDSGRIVFLTE